MSSEVESFIKLFTPYRTGYGYKRQGQIWLRSGGFLKDELIQAAINGEAVIGFLVMYRTAVLGLDVDDHDGGGWISGRASEWDVGKMTSGILGVAVVLPQDRPGGGFFGRQHRSVGYP